MINKTQGYCLNFSANRQNVPASLHDSFPMSYRPALPMLSYDKKKEEQHIGKRIVKIALLTSLCVFIGLKGSSKKIRSKFDQANKNFADLNFNNAENSPLKFYASKFLRKMTEGSKAIFNLAPLKDVLLAKWMEKSKFTSNLAQNIADAFEKISFRTVKKSYWETHGKLDDFFAICAETNKNQKVSKAHADKINGIISTIRTTFSEGFCETARRERLSKIKQELDGFDAKGNKVEDSLRDKVWKEMYLDFKNYAKTKIYKSFISESLTSKTKIKHAMEVNKITYVISNSLRTMCEDCFNLLKHMDTFIDADDKGTRDFMKELAIKLNAYKKHIRDTEGDGHEILLDGKVIEHLRQINEKCRKNNKYNQATLDMISAEIDVLVERLSNHKRGGVNQILHIYKGILGEKNPEFLKILKVAYDATGSLEKSVDLETDKMFDKVRDLKIGSAPKDTLALIIPLGAVGYGINKADTMDEKISAGIKYGVPVMGAIAITTYCTIGLVSAGPSLLIGALAGLALNQIGSEVDNFRKSNHKG